MYHEQKLCFFVRHVRHIEPMRMEYQVLVHCLEIWPHVSLGPAIAVWNDKKLDANSKASTPQNKPFYLVVYLATCRTTTIRHWVNR